MCGRIAKPDDPARSFADQTIVEDELSLYLHKGVYTAAQMQGSLLEHERIVDAVRNGRVAEAAEAFESHVLNGKRRMLDTVSR